MSKYKPNLLPWIKKSDNFFFFIKIKNKRNGIGVFFYCNMWLLMMVQCESMKFDDLRKREREREKEEREREKRSKS